MIVDEIWPEAPAVDAPVTQYVTRDDVKARALAFRNACPTFHIGVPAIVTEGGLGGRPQRVDRNPAGRVQWDPRDRPATWTRLEMYRFACGQIVGALDLRRDLGVITEEELASVATPAAP